jgi:RNA polymerase sigma factor (sigma-70 family)
VSDGEGLRKILTAAAEGDQEAFARLIELGHDDMTRVAFVVSGDVDLAGEATQTAWSEVWKGLPTMRNPERVGATLMALAAREARQLADGAASRPTPTDDSGAPVTRAASQPAYRSDEVVLVKALSTFDSHDRVIVALRYVAALTPDEIAPELGMPDGAVRARLAKILQTFLETLGPHGGEDETVEAYENALTERLRAFADRAVEEFDASVVAVAAVDAARPSEATLQLAVILEQLRSLDPRVWIGAGAFVVVAAVFLLLTGGGGGGVPIATPIPTDASRACRLDELAARVTGWTTSGNAKQATVELRNTSQGACFIESRPEPWLIQKPQVAMIIGRDPTHAQMRIGPGDVLTTLVTVRNYCGPAPNPPVSIAFRQGTDVILATPLNGSDLSGVPPCTGGAGSEGSIVMGPWAP